MTIIARLAQWFRTPPCDLIDPLSAEDRARKAWADAGERARYRGLTEIHKATADNLAYFADHQPRGYAWTFKPGGKP